MQDIQSLVLELMIFSYPFPRKRNVKKIFKKIIQASVKIQQAIF